MLIVVAKAKAFVKEKAQMNTSKETTDILSTHVKNLLEEATVLASKDGRRTVMGRDVQQAIEGVVK